MKQIRVSATMQTRINISYDSRERRIIRQDFTCAKSNCQEAKFVLLPNTKSPEGCLHLSFACNFVTLNKV